MSLVGLIARCKIANDRCEALSGDQLREAIDDEDAILNARPLKPHVVGLDVTMPTGRVGSCKGNQERSALDRDSLRHLRYLDDRCFCVAGWGASCFIKIDFNVKLVPFIQELLQA